jgi:hypothetical protein
MAGLLTLHSNKQTIIEGSIASAPYKINASTYFILGKDFIRGNLIRWSEIYSFLFSNLRGNLNINRETLLDLFMSGEDIKAHRFAVGTSIHHGIYAIMSNTVIIPNKEDIPEEEQENITFSELYNKLLSSLESQLPLTIYLGDDEIPPSQEEHRVSAKYAACDEYFVPINPLRNTVRRTLAYTNYILDSNSVMDADPGDGYSSMFSINNWSANWFIAGELRRFFNWRRRRQGGLTHDDAPPCSNAEIGATSMSDWLVPVWKGFSTYRKNDNSTAWIPFELYAWPCASLARFYSVASWVDKCTTCEQRSLPIASLFPLIITSPIGVMGFQHFEHISRLTNYCMEKKYYPLYVRPYSDDSDGSGIWHGLS